MGSKHSKLPNNKKPINNNNKHHLETDISCPGCNVNFPKNTPF